MPAVCDKATLRGNSRATGSTEKSSFFRGTKEKSLNPVIQTSSKFHTSSSILLKLVSKPDDDDSVSETCDTARTPLKQQVRF